MSALLSMVFSIEETVTFLAKVDTSLLEAAIAMTLAYVDLNLIH